MTHYKIPRKQEWKVYWSTMRKTDLCNLVILLEDRSSADVPLGISWSLSATSTCHIFWRRIPSTRLLIELKNMYNFDLRFEWDKLCSHFAKRASRILYFKFRSYLNLTCRTRFTNIILNKFSFNCRLINIQMP